MRTAQTGCVGGGWKENGSRVWWPGAVCLRSGWCHQGDTAVRHPGLHPAGGGGGGGGAVRAPSLSGSDTAGWRVNQISASLTLRHSDVLIETGLSQAARRWFEFSREVSVFRAAASVCISDDEQGLKQEASPVLSPPTPPVPCVWLVLLYNTHLWTKKNVNCRQCRAASHSVKSMNRLSLSSQQLFLSFCWIMTEHNLIQMSLFWCWAFPPAILISILAGSCKQRAKCPASWKCRKELR